MSTHVLRHRRDNLELLERILNKSSLTTKRAGHGHILDIGADLLSRTHVDVDAMKQTAVKEALEAAEKRHTRELRAALRRLRQESEDDKNRALTKQKEFYEDLARRVAEQRDRAEEEHIRELTRKHDKQREEALRVQWEECERLKQAAILEANNTMKARLRREFDEEKRDAIEQALAEAAEMYRIHEENVIAATTRQCQKEAADEAARVAKLHAEEVSRLQHRYALLNQRYHKELDQRQRVEQDFRDLQLDYQRFMDYTDGRFNSGFMMKLRHHGNQLADKRISVAQSIEKL